jgi:hypothetical protein
MVIGYLGHLVWCGTLRERCVGHESPFQKRLLLLDRP